MENFVVSARKYRPVGFEEVVGQEHITTTLKNAIDNNKLAQALLFCGLRGVGKTICARIVARLINDQTIDNPLMGNDTFKLWLPDHQHPFGFVSGNRTIMGHTISHFNKTAFIGPWFFLAPQQTKKWFFKKPLTWMKRL